MPSIISSFVTENKVIKVESKEVSVKNKDSLYLIFTKDETYEVDDSIFTLNYQSSDDYHKIKIDHCYKVKLRGMRIGFLNMYRNIEKYQEVSCDER